MDSVPEYARQALEDRLETHARTAWTERCAGVKVRFRGKYAYVDVFDSDPWIMPGSTNEEKEQILQTPVKMCRLGWTSDMELWDLAFHRYSDGKYVPSLHFDGSGRSSPEACFDCAAQVYLR
jgi:hypothetical protein